MAKVADNASEAGSTPTLRPHTITQSHTMNISKIIPTDKVHHMVYSYAITKALRVVLPWYAAAGVAFIIGVGKEIYDKVSGKGTPEWADLLADCCGIILGCVL